MIENPVLFPKFFFWPDLLNVKKKVFISPSLPLEIIFPCSGLKNKISKLYFKLTTLICIILDTITSIYPEELITLALFLTLPS